MVFVFFILMVAAAESAIGLAILSAVPQQASSIAVWTNSTRSRAEPRFIGFNMSQTLSASMLLLAVPLAFLAVP